MAAVAWNHSVKRPQYQPQRDASGCNPLICPLAMRILAAKLRLMSSEHRNAICFSCCHIVVIFKRIFTNNCHQSP